MNGQVSFSRILSGTLLIAGTMIGAGMLGIPLMTGACGFIPGALVTVLVWIFMYLTGLLFLEVSLWMPDGSHVLSISDYFFRKGGRLLSGGMFIFLYYCLMVAYFAAGTPLLADAFRVIGISLSCWSAFFLFGLIFGTIVAIGPKSIDRVNMMMSVAMIGSWLILIGSGQSEVESKRLFYTNWSSMVFAMPVLFSAFGFHNIIPSLCTYLKRDRAALRASIFWGSILPLFVYLVWQWLMIGAIPREALMKTLQTKAPIITTFQSLTGETYFVRLGRFFVFFAIITSVLGVSFSLVDFLGDGFGVVHRRGWKRIGLTTLTFAPPMFLAGFNPDIFSTALGIAGGFGEAFLNGLLPVSFMWAGKYVWKLETDLKVLGNRFFLSLLILYGLFVMVLEGVYLMIR